MNISLLPRLGIFLFALKAPAALSFFLSVHSFNSCSILAAFIFDTIANRFSFNGYVRLLNPRQLSCNRHPVSMRSLRLGLDIVMLALLLRQVLATIRHSREIIITDAVGAASPLLPLYFPSSVASWNWKWNCNWGWPTARGFVFGIPNYLSVTTHASLGLQMSSDKCAKLVCEM